MAGFAADDIVLLAGSTQEPEESLALAAFRQLAPAHPRLRLVLVPRHPDRFAAVAAMLDTAGVVWQRRSRLARNGSPEPLDRLHEQGGDVPGQTDGSGEPSYGLRDDGSGEPSYGLRDDGSGEPSYGARVLLVDAVGELGAWWGMADIGFVGGSLSTRGGQNMIEPAAYGVAVSFGPNTHNFRDIVAALLAERAAVVVHDGDELLAFVRRALEDAEFALKLGERAKEFVSRQLGATDRTLMRLLPLFESRPVGILTERHAA